MKITGKVKIKENVSDYTIGRVVDTAVGFMFEKTSDDEIRYTPYLMNMGLRAGIILYLIDGIEVEEDEWPEDIYEKDEVIKSLVDDYIVDGNDINYIRANVYDVLEFKKNITIHLSEDIRTALTKSLEKEQKLTDAMTKFVEQQNKILEHNAKNAELSDEITSKMTADEIVELNRKIISGDFVNIIDSVADAYTKKLTSEDKTANDDKVADDDKIVSINKKDSDA